MGDDFVTLLLIVNVSFRSTERQTPFTAGFSGLTPYSRRPRQELSKLSENV